MGERRGGAMTASAERVSTCAPTTCSPSRGADARAPMGGLGRRRQLVTGARRRAARPPAADAAARQHTRHVLAREPGAPLPPVGGCGGGDRRDGRGDGQRDRGRLPHQLLLREAGAHSSRGAGRAGARARRFPRRGGGGELGGRGGGAPSPCRRAGRSPGARRCRTWPAAIPRSTTRCARCSSARARRSAWSRSR